MHVSYILPEELLKHFLQGQSRGNRYPWCFFIWERLCLFLMDNSTAYIILDWCLFSHNTVSFHSLPVGMVSEMSGVIIVYFWIGKMFSSGFFLFFLIKKPLNWRIIALQCRFSFCPTATCGNWLKVSMCPLPPEPPFHLAPPRLTPLNHHGAPRWAPCYTAAAH